MHEVMDALSNLVKHADFARKAMSLLGKLGGRSHAHIAGPQDLAYKANPEQGLRATLTFAEPPTTFLLPLDRIIQYVTSDPGDAPVATSPHFRRQSFEFVRTCLCTMMNLGGQVAGGAGKNGEDAPGWQGDGAKLVAMLTGALQKEVAAAPAGAAAKTKLQQQAEEHCFQVCPLLSSCTVPIDSCAALL